MCPYLGPRVPKGQLRVRQAGGENPQRLGHDETLQSAGHSMRPCSAPVGRQRRGERSTQRPATKLVYPASDETRCESNTMLEFALLAGDPKW